MELEEVPVPPLVSAGMGSVELLCTGCGEVIAPTEDPNLHHDSCMAVTRAFFPARGGERVCQVLLYVEPCDASLVIVCFCSACKERIMKADPKRWVSEYLFFRCKSDLRAHMLESGGVHLGATDFEVR